MKMFGILTVESPGPGGAGRNVATIQRTTEAASRTELFERMKLALGPAGQTGNVTFFYAEPDEPVR